MKRVFVFCIGGTGLRVMKSITMLLAAGMDAKGYTIVPIYIDPHLALEERRNLHTLISEYESIYNSINTSENSRLKPKPGFFSTNILDFTKLKGQQNDSSAPAKEKSSFGQFINFGNLNSDDVNRLLVQSIFSQANLDNDLDVGFKGSPNVGTVVLGELIKGADWFQVFCNECQAGDRVFIISSIFGGTGASGFPLLEKKIRQSKDNPNVAKAMLGAVSVLPYYSLEDPSTTDSDIDSANFYTKAKSALAYYEDNVKPDFLYYIGEQHLQTTYANDEKKQEDKAHFIELIAATALFDFIEKTDIPETMQAMSRSIKSDETSLSITELGDAYNDVVKVVADMTLLNRIVNILPKETQFPLSIDRDFDEEFYNDRSFENLKNFLTRFSEWYAELSANTRSFAPIAIGREGSKERLTNWIKHFSLNAKDESYYLLDMIKASNKDKDDSEDVRIRHFVDYAYKAINGYTQKLIKQ